MTILDWTTALAVINGDNTSIAVTIRAKVSMLGAVYDRAGHPDFMTEAASHVTWRGDMAAQLAARDRTAASIDGLPLTSIDSANPAASRTPIIKRMGAVRASGPVGVLISDFEAAKLPPEPNQWVDGYYDAASSNSGFKVVGDIEAALRAALDELAAYVSFR